MYQYLMCLVISNVSIHFLGSTLFWNNNDSMNICRHHNEHYIEPKAYIFTIGVKKGYVCLQLHACTINDIL